MFKDVLYSRKCTLLFASGNFTFLPYCFVEHGADYENVNKM